MRLKVTFEGIEIEVDNWIARFINSLIGKYCEFCGRKKQPRGYNSQLRCPNNCAIKAFQKERLS